MTFDVFILWLATLIIVPWTVGSAIRWYFREKWEFHKRVIQASKGEQ